MPGSTRGARVGDLSLSQQQLVEIAKVVSRNPSIVVFDEPTSSLGDKETRILFNVIKRLRESGIAILYISHRLQEVMEIGDRVTVLRDGATSRPATLPASPPTRWSA